MISQHPKTRFVPLLVALAFSTLAFLPRCGLVRHEIVPPPLVASKAPGATVVGIETCLACHDDVGEEMLATVHGSLPTDSDRARELCESCHGPGSLHVQSGDPGDIFGATDIRGLGNEDRCKVCLACHETMYVQWSSRSPHRGREISCWDCHADAVHGETSVVDPLIAPAKPGGGKDGSAFCLQCHGDVEQQFEMPVKHASTDGMVDCSGCHGVHGESGSIEGAASVDEVCLRCHTKMAGPWVWEHEAMYEGCTFCHEPHGTPNPELLVQNGNGLCLQCHIEETFPQIGMSGHGGYLLGGATCWQCHFDLHGSNTSEILAPGW
jgi:DmsE family decaheme c-type cytochrome